MLRSAILCCSLILLGAALVGATPVGGRGAQRGLSVDPGGGKFYPTVFKGGERASVIVIGNGRTPMGLYVYDQHGNCIARDDLGSGKTKDDLAVEWYPPRTADYNIEVRNFGPLPNEFSIARR